MWDPDLCIQCGQCGFACPHGVIRAKYFHEEAGNAAPAGFKEAPINSRGNPDVRFALQVYLEDCTGCGICVEVCPALSAREPGKNAINLADKAPILEAERSAPRLLRGLPMNDRARVDFANVRGCSSCSRCLSSPGLAPAAARHPISKVLSQFFGDRLQIANATGCSSIYGGNLPVTPWTVDDEGRGPAWSNSLFEDNAEFGLGFRLAATNIWSSQRRCCASLPRGWARISRGNPRGAAETQVGASRAARPRRRAEAEAHRHG